MRSELSSIEQKNKLYKLDKINKKTKTIKTKPYHSNICKQKGIFSNTLNKYNNSSSNIKKDENNSSILNSQKKFSIQPNKSQIPKNNKIPINKKLNIIKEIEENHGKNIINKKINPRNNNRLIPEKNKSYVLEDKRKQNNIKIPKKDGQLPFLMKKFTLQDDNKAYEKFSSNLKFKTSKSSNIDCLMHDKIKREREKEKEKEREHNKNIINNLKAKKNKLKQLIDAKKNNNANQDDIFVYDENKPITLSEEELLIYGDRTMKGYNKIKILGKGGYGVVWLCKKIKTKENYGNTDMDYAVKQTSKKNAQTHNKEDVLQIAKNEIDILTKLNDNKNNRGEKCDLIPKIYETYEDNNDIWFSFEKGGLSITTLTFNIKGIFEKGERLYHIQKGEFLVLLFKNIKQFKLLIRKILEGIDYINKNGIIHSDIKPENILVQYTKHDDVLDISSIKIVDYGSAFYSSDESPLISNTPEYLCPEIMTNNKEFIKELNRGKYLNAMDIWSTGISILELCLCCPIWMSYKTKIYINGKINNNMGYFGCKGRDGNKIYQKQIELSHNLNKILKNSMIYMFDDRNKSEFIDLLSKMLTFDYTKRITTKEALRHPFLNDDDENDNNINISEEMKYNDEDE